MVRPPALSGGIAAYCRLASCCSKTQRWARPIAVRRSAAKCVHEVTLNAVSSAGSQRGGACGALRVKAWRREDHPDEVIVQVDLRNAFHSIGPQHAVAPSASGESVHQVNLGAAGLQFNFLK